MQTQSPPHPAGLPRHTNVLIIGGGVIGVCAAYYLAAQGREVTLIEQNEIGSGCSHGNAGWVVPSHSIPLATPAAVKSGLKWMLNPASPFYIRPRPDPALALWLLRFARAANDAAIRRAVPVLRDLNLTSRALYDDLAAAAGFDFGYQQRGMLQVCKTAGSFAAAQVEAHELHEFGLRVDVLDSAQVREREPLLQPDVAGGLFFPDDAHLDPAAFTHGLARAAEACGARIVTRTRVLGFEVEGDRVMRVRTSAGGIAADEVVLAAGSWSPAVSRDLRLRLPVQPGKGYSITVRRPARCPAVPLSLAEARVAVTPMRDTLRFAGTMELSGMDPAINDVRVNAILRAARAYLQDMGALETLEVWAGLRPCMPDGLPVIGRPDAPRNLVVATGHAMLGVSLGPVTGKLVAQLVQGQRVELDLHPLRPQRF